MTVPALHTPRLELAPLAMSDTTDLHAAMRDPEVMRYWNQPPHGTIEETREAVGQLVKAGTCHWAVRLRGSDRCIGYVGFLSDQAPQGFGYLLHPHYWRRGLMTEAASAALSSGFTSMGFEQAEAWIAEGNSASLALARGLGFKPVGQLIARYPHRTDSVRLIVHGLWAHDFLGTATPQPTRPAAFSIMPQLEVRDIGRSIAFYVGRLGFRVAFSVGAPPIFAALTPSAWGGSPVQLRIRKTSEEVVPPTEIVITVEAIGSLYDRYRAAGVTFERPLETMPWEMQEFAVRDPDGYVVRFTGQ